jgi:hypothetical protein
MIKFCPSCGGIVEMAADIHMLNMHDRICRCVEPTSSLEPDLPVALTEEQIRAIVRDEVAKALADVKQEFASEAPAEIAKQVRRATGNRGSK